jgi:hypothetical protein
VISLTAFDGTAHPANSTDVPKFVFLIAVLIFVIALAITKLEVTLREWEQVSVPRTISRAFVAFTFVLGIAAGALVLTRQWVHIEACRTVGELETCQGQASPRQVLGMLAWHAASVVPVLDIPHSLEWQRPARSANPAGRHSHQPTLTYGIPGIEAGGWYPAESSSLTLTSP